MLWKLPMKRTTRWDAERWGMPIGYYGGGTYSSYSAKTDEPREERPPHKHPVGEAPVTLGPTTKNGSMANGSGTKGRAKRRQLSRAANRASGQSVVRKGLVNSVNSAEFYRALRVLPSRQRQQHREPPNGRVQAARNRRRRRRKPPNGGIRAAQRRVSGGR
jgi:hypothetical protein